MEIQKVEEYPVDIADMALTPQAIVKRVALVHEAMEEAMKVGVHYGKIPGTPKPTLFKSGAEILGVLFQISPHFEVLSSTRTRDVVSYTVCCTYKHNLTGNSVGNGTGSCNTLETRYSDTIATQNRNRARRGKPETACAWELDNTVLKMACKRAMVSAILSATAASDVFTQDVEDYQPAKAGRDLDLGAMLDARKAPRAAGEFSEADKLRVRCAALVSECQKADVDPGLKMEQVKDIPDDDLPALFDDLTERLKNA